MTDLGQHTLGLVPCNGADEPSTPATETLWMAALGRGGRPFPLVRDSKVMGTPVWEDDARWERAKARVDSALTPKGWARDPGVSLGNGQAWQGAGQRLALVQMASPGDATGDHVLLAFRDRPRQPT